MKRRKRNMPLRYIRSRGLMEDRLEGKTNGWDALEVKVGVLESDVREVKDGLLGLDTKIDRAVASISLEVRTSLDAIRNQLAERQRTPWMTVISAGSLVVVVLGIFGSQQITPLNNGIASLEAHIKQTDAIIVPRDEITATRAAVSNSLSAIDARITKLEDRDYRGKEREIDRLRDQIRDLTHK